MMDSQDKILKQDVSDDNMAAAAANVENNPTVTAPEEQTQPIAPEATAETPAPEAEQPQEQRTYATKQAVLDRVKEIAHSDETPAKDEIDHLKTVFYKLHFAERDAEQKAYLAAGGDPEKYTVMPDEQEEAFKAEMGIIREKRAEAFRKLEAEKQDNLQKKQAIIDKIKMMSTSPEEANKSYNEFKELQQQWRDIKAVPADKANELWRNYQLYVEQFYDLLNLNRELREYDFKKNLEQKTQLCEAAEKLADEPDAVSAFHQLQELHQQYREIGPVAKELREQIWTRFKAASTVVNKRHQQYFENLRAKEEENLTRKTALCEQVEAIAKEDNKGAGDWEKHTKQIIEIQGQWKTIGFAPQKMNVKIFDRFRAACDDFFGRKAEYFKTLKTTFAENIKKKRALVDQAKALADSTEWKSTADKLINLQKEWKTIGMVPKKVGDQLWAEFIGACNTFFDARNAATADSRNEEQQNLSQKRGIVDQLRQLLDAKEGADDAQSKIQQLTDQYAKIGHVPFRDKDKLFRDYHKVLDALYKQLNISVSKQRLDNFKSSLKDMAKHGEDSLDNERGRLMHRYEQLKSEIVTYENNLGFLSVSSKKGSSLIDEMNRKVGKLKDDLELIRQKIKAIDAENK
ncbi:MAG: DUF349 domain-containing protein [Prevotella sp.]|nr:DUF349 domain-containing protein [Prevotella sp.]MDY3247133.1 DUF349 domain-containing protein [Prevotella sp.]